MDLDFAYWEYRVFAWGCALLLAAGMLVARRSHWSKALGIAIMTVPLWMTLLGIIESFGPLLAGGTVLRAYSREQLSRMYSLGLLSDLGYLGAGFILWQSRGTWRGLGQLNAQELASRLRQAGLDAGRDAARNAARNAANEARSNLHGWLLLPILLAGAILTRVLLSGSQALTNNDESRVFDNMTPYHAVMVSLAAGFGEELLFRGFLQTALRKWMPFGLALAVQAVFFGFAHAGYGNWAHVIQPTLFGVIAGLVAWRFGIWAAIVLHVLIDIYAFAGDAAGNAPWWGTVLEWTLALNAAMTVTWLARGTWRRMRSRPASPAIAA